METLAERIARDGPVNELDAIGWAIRLAKRLEALHVLGVAHGSVSPACILTAGQDRNARAYLADVQHTSSSPAYQSPERILGGDISIADDVWALAATLYALLTGTSPFAGGNDAEVRQRILAASPAPLAVYDVGDDDLQHILHTAFAREPSHRLSSVAALRRSLEEWHPDRGVAVLPPLEDEDSTNDDDEDVARTMMVRDGGAYLQQALQAPLPKANVDADDDDDDVRTVMRQMPSGDLASMIAKAQAAQAPQPPQPAAGMGPPGGAPSLVRAPAPPVRKATVQGFPPPPELQAPRPPAYGGGPPSPRAPGSYGQPPQNPYGPPPSPGGYGQPPQNPYGAPPQNPYGPPAAKPPAPAAPVFGGRPAPPPAPPDDDDDDDEGARTVMRSPEQLAVEGAQDARKLSLNDGAPPPWQQPPGPRPAAGLGAPPSFGGGAPGGFGPPPGPAGRAPEPPPWGPPSGRGAPAPAPTMALPAFDPDSLGPPGAPLPAESRLGGGTNPMGIEGFDPRGHDPHMLGGGTSPMGIPGFDGRGGGFPQGPPPPPQQQYPYQGQQPPQQPPQAPAFGSMAAAGDLSALEGQGQWPGAPPGASPPGVGPMIGPGAPAPMEPAAARGRAILILAALLALLVAAGLTYLVLHARMK